jgi:hypothetical protein
MSKWPKISLFLTALAIVVFKILDYHNPAA